MLAILFVIHIKLFPFIIYMRTNARAMRALGCVIISHTPKGLVSHVMDAKDAVGFVDLYFQCREDQNVKLHDLVRTDHVDYDLRHVINLTKSQNMYLRLL